MVHSPFKGVARRGGLCLADERKGKGLWHVPMAGIYWEALGCYQNNVCAFKPPSALPPLGKCALSLQDVQGLCLHSKGATSMKLSSVSKHNLVGQRNNSPGKWSSLKRSPVKCYRSPWEWASTANYGMDAGVGLHRGGGIWACTGGMQQGGREGLWC